MPIKRIEPTGVNVYIQMGGLYEKKVTYKKEMKQEISYLVTNIGDVPEHQLTNFVRISFVNFSDPDFGPSEQLDYGQSDHIKEMVHIGAIVMSTSKMEINYLINGRDPIKPFLKKVVPGKRIMRENLSLLAEPEILII